MPATVAADSIDDLPVAPAIDGNASVAIIDEAVKIEAGATHGVETIDSLLDNCVCPVE